MSELNSTLFNCIVDFLVPYMGGTESQRNSLIAPMFRSYKSLYSKIDWSGPSQEFTIRLVGQLDLYGEIKSGKQALVLLLKGLRSEVGINNQHTIDDLCQLLETHQASPEKSKSMTKLSNQNLKWLLRAIILLLSVISIQLLLLLQPSLLFTASSIPDKLDKQVADESNFNTKNNTVSDHISENDVIAAKPLEKTTQSISITHDASSENAAIIDSFKNLSITESMTVTDNIQLGGVLNGPTSYWADYRPYIRFLKQDGVDESDLCPEGGIPIGAVSPLQSLSVKTGNDLASILYGGAGICINVHQIAPCGTINGNYFPYGIESCEIDFSGKWAPFYWWDGMPTHGGISTKLLGEGIGCFPVKYACVK